MRIAARARGARTESRRRRWFAAFLVPALMAGTLAFARLSRDRSDANASEPRRSPESLLTTPELITRAVETGRIDADTAWVSLAKALYAPDEVPSAYRSPAGWSATHVLLALNEAMGSGPGSVEGPPPAMRPDTRAAIEGLRASRLAAADNASRRCDAFATPTADTRQTANFHIEFNPASIVAPLTIEDYATSLEEAYQREVTTFGWPGPVFKGAGASPSIGNRIHVRIEPLTGGVLGFAINDGSHAGQVGDNPNTTDVTEVEADAACVVLNANFSGTGVTSAAKMRSTMAHELNHVLQFGLGALRQSRRPDFSFIEGLSVFMEDEVFDDANLGTIRPWPRFEESLGQHGNQSDLDVYNIWVVFRAMLERYGTTTADGGEQVAQDFWRAVGKVNVPTRTDGKAMFEALSAAVTAQGDTNLADAFHAYAIAVRFSRACSGGLGYPNCLEEGPQWLQAKGPLPTPRSVTQVGGAPVAGTVQDDYALNWVGLPVGASYDVTVRNTAAAGTGKLRTSAVCETATGLMIRQLPQVVVGGATSTLGGFDARNCQGAVAVITNEANTEANPASSATRSYELATTAAAPGDSGGGGGGGGGTTTTTTTTRPGDTTTTTVCPTTTTTSTSSTSTSSTSTSSTSSTVVTGTAGPVIAPFTHNDCRRPPCPTSSTSTSTTEPCDPSGGGDGDRRGGDAECHGRDVTIEGTDGRDTIVGTTGRDVIHARGGDDVIDGLGGDDVICGGGGNDRIDAGDGDDEVHGGDGNDRVFGGRGDDLLKGGGGNDRLFGGGGDDEIRGGDGNDRVSGGGGDDSLLGDGGIDRLVGGPGRDRFRGGAGDDKVADGSTGSQGVGSQGGG